MIVLEHGSEYKVLICRGCGAKLGIWAEDIIKEHNSFTSMKGIHEEKLEYIQCPECKTKHYIRAYVDGDDWTDDLNNIN